MPLYVGYYLVRLRFLLQNNGIRNMPSLDWISNFLDVIFYLLLGHKWLIPTQRGGRLLKIFESGIAGWFRAWANTEILAEVSALKKFFIQSLRVIIAALILLAISPLRKLPVVQQIGPSLGIIFLIACVGWVSLDWTFDHRSSIRSSFTLDNLTQTLP